MRGLFILIYISMHMKQSCLKKKSKASKQQGVLMPDRSSWRGAVLELWRPGVGVCCWANSSGSQKLRDLPEIINIQELLIRTPRTNVFCFNLCFTAPHCSQLSTQKFGKGKTKEKVTVWKESRCGVVCVDSPNTQEAEMGGSLGYYPGQHDETPQREREMKATGMLGASGCLV